MLENTGLWPVFLVGRGAGSENAAIDLAKSAGYQTKGHWGLDKNKI